MDSARIAPGLLLAMPQLDDPNFQRAVVLMVQHTEQGSFGLVLNRPSETPVIDVTAPMGMRWRGDPSAVIWVGGPVSPESGWLLHEPTDTVAAGEGTLEVTHEISLSTSPQHFRALVEHPPRRVRLFAGYAGWGAHQLESELAQGAWLTAGLTPALVFDTPAERMWDEALHSLGIEPASLVPGAGVH
ncbi:MAG TPA: YqgE/AlgH family protein [Myxococcota bacterium]|nr:YqgE/AlgH family protein [Myxococcota bacterium]